MITPINDRIVVSPEKPEDVTKTGLYIPSSAQKKPQSGKIISVGDGFEGVPMKLKEGDYILYGLHTGIEIDFKGEKYVIMRQSDVLAKIS